MIHEIIGVSFEPNTQKSDPDYALTTHGRFGLLSKPHVEYPLTEANITDSLFRDTAAMIKFKGDYSFIAFQPGTCISNSITVDSFLADVVAEKSDVIKALGILSEFTLVFEITEQPMVNDVSPAEYLIELSTQKLNDETRSESIAVMQKTVRSELEKINAEMFISTNIQTNRCIFRFACSPEELVQISNSLDVLFADNKFEASLSAPGPVRFFARQMKIEQHGYA